MRRLLEVKSYKNPDRRDQKSSIPWGLFHRRAGERVEGTRLFRRPKSLRWAFGARQCYGQQLMGHMLGGEVFAGEKREYGKIRLSNLKTARFLTACQSFRPCWMSHTIR
jgi:hypothetical protein